MSTMKKSADIKVLGSSTPESANESASGISVVEQRLAPLLSEIAVLMCSARAVMVEARQGDDEGWMAMGAERLVSVAGLLADVGCHAAGYPMVRGNEAAAWLVPARVRADLAALEREGEE